MPSVRRFVLAGFAAAMLIATGSRAEGPGEILVDVDSAKREMRVMQGDKILAAFDHVSVGRWGVSHEKRRGDGKTPLGEFRIAWEKAEGQFGPFMGLDYPSLARAEKGLAAGEISRAEFDAIKAAHADGRIPPQNTRLGGQIGIHGIGRADPGIHRDLNWTKGCVALTNAQMRQFMNLAGKGARVRIR